MNPDQAAALARVDQRAENAEPVIAAMHERIDDFDALAARMIDVVNAIGRLETILSAMTTGVSVEAASVAKAVIDLAAKRLSD